MAVDPSTQVVGLVIQSIGAIILGLLFWFSKKAYNHVKQINIRLDHLDECVDEQRRDLIAHSGEVRAARGEAESRDNLHRVEAVERDKEIAQLRVDYAGLEGWVKGTNKMQIDRPITEIDPAINGGSS